MTRVPLNDAAVVGVEQRVAVGRLLGRILRVEQRPERGGRHVAAARAVGAGDGQGPKDSRP